ncbi:TlpA family protein disulfide reductase [Ornithinimicrobium sp. LYQ121]|uniref:TlpA family protein disulfide reductase n=1 Tax=Ornithinimicrobium sp. LYQ121 TaxID=3378801 RepID=UPI003852F8A3
MNRRAHRLPLTVLAAASLTLTACSDDNTINAQMRQGDELGYVAGDGAVEQLVPEQRETTILLEGTTLEDEPWTSADHAGEVLVVNVWGSWCGPCIAEAPDLEAVASELVEAGEPVQFIGVNVRDSVPSALAFQEAKGVSYPSLVDDGGRTLAQLQGLAVARPTTMLLDGQGRLAARVNGQVDAATLRGLIDDVLESEPAA